MREPMPNIDAQREADTGRLAISSQTTLSSSAFAYTRDGVAFIDRQPLPICGLNECASPSLIAAEEASAIPVQVDFLLHCGMLIEKL